MKMKKIYLAGPMTGLPKDNYPAFNHVAKQLRSDGHFVYNPAEFKYDKRKHKTFPMREAFAEYCAFLCNEADSVMLLPGWEKSLGVSAELALAKNFDLPVFEYGKGDTLVDHSFVDGLNARGLQYEMGKGPTQDYVMAAHAYRQAAELGYAPAQANFARLCSWGEGVPVDLDEAVKWLILAADQGDLESMTNLGMMYLHGLGIKQDDLGAVKWTQMASKLGYAPAQNNFGTMLHRGHGVEQNSITGIQWHRAAAVQGYADAQHSLGVSYEHGKGVIPDIEQAVKWYKRAADQGNVQSKNDFDRILLDLGIDAEEYQRRWSD